MSYCGPLGVAELVRVCAEDPGFETLDVTPVGGSAQEREQIAELIQGTNNKVIRLIPWDFDSKVALISVLRRWANRRVGDTLPIQGSGGSDFPRDIVRNIFSYLSTEVRRKFVAEP